MPCLTRRALLATAAATPLAAPRIARAAPTTLRFVPQANLTTLDPIFTTATVTINHGYYVFDTLYATDSQSRPRPQMADGHEVSGNGLTWRIHLRDGLRFHDGTPVRAADCAASLARWAKRDPFGQVLNRAVEQWGAPDDRTFEIKLTRPFPLLLDAIGKPDANPAFVMPERLARTDATAALTEMVGSGPYRFLPGEYVSGSRNAYARFDGYNPRTEAPDWASGGKVAHFDRVEWQVIPDSATAASALQRGEVDWWEQPLPDLLPSLAGQGITTQVDQPAGRLAIMRMNTLQPPFDNVKVRRAVLMAVNQDDYMHAVAGDDPSLSGGCRSLYPCGTPYASETLGSTLIKGDIRAAKALLDQSGYAGQRVVVINPTDFPTIGPLGQVTADMLRKLGMNVDLQEMDWGSVVQRRTSREPVDKGGWSIFHTFGSAPAYANPAVSALVRGQGAAGWYGWWSSPHAEELVGEWLAATDPAAQARLARQIGDLALEEVATVPLGRFFVKTAFRSSITGVLQGTSPFPWNVRPA